MNNGFKYFGITDYIMRAFDESLLRETAYHEGYLDGIEYARNWINEMLSGDNDEQQKDHDKSSTPENNHRDCL